MGGGGSLKKKFALSRFLVVSAKITGHFKRTLLLKSKNRRGKGASGPVPWILDRDSEFFNVNSG